MIAISRKGRGGESAPSSLEWGRCPRSEPLHGTPGHLSRYSSCYLLYTSYCTKLANLCHYLLITNYSPFGSYTCTRGYDPVQRLYHVYPVATIAAGGALPHVCVCLQGVL